MASQLTKQQQYLLNRLPNSWSMRAKERELKEPVAVRQARRLVERFDERKRKHERREQKRMTALLTSAKEAIYFQTPEKALKIVKRLEAMADNNH